MAIVMIVRGKPKDEWDNYQFKPLENEVTFDTTNKRLKIGDNENFWKDLPYVDIDVIDNLTTSDSRPALSAKQGVVLKTMINTKADKTELTQLQEDLTQIINNHKVSVVDELKSTNSHTDPLSAYQGYVLDSTKASKDELTTLQTNITNEINNSKVTVVDKLLSSNSRTAALSAYQGYALKQMIPDGVTVYDKLDNSSTTYALSANMGRELNNQKASKTELTTLETNIRQEINNSKVVVVNVLTDSSTDKALSANMGKKLSSDKLDKSSITSESWTFTLESGSTVTKKVALSS